VSSDECCRWGWNCRAQPDVDARLEAKKRLRMILVADRMNLAPTAMVSPKPSLSLSPSLSPSLPLSPSLSLCSVTSIVVLRAEQSRALRGPPPLAKGWDAWKPDSRCCGSRENGAIPSMFNVHGDAGVDQRSGLSLTASH
jgi:hypothetical protein